MSFKNFLILKAKLRFVTLHNFILILTNLSKKGMFAPIQPPYSDGFFKFSLLLESCYWQD